MTAKVVTFSVQIGAGGFEIARAVSEQLQYQYCDSDITAQIARQVGASPEEVAAAVERVPSLIQGILERLALSNTADMDISDPTPETLTTQLTSLRMDDYRRMVEKLVTELAARGQVVIVGHAGQVTLRDEPDVFKVLVLGSAHKREERLMGEMNVDKASAKTIVEQSDQDRANFFERVHRIDWLRPNHYDLCINTDLLPITAATDMVLAGARSF